MRKAAERFDHSLGQLCISPICGLGEESPVLGVTIGHVVRAHEGVGADDGWLSEISLHPRRVGLVQPLVPRFCAFCSMHKNTRHSKAQL